MMEKQGVARFDPETFKNYIDRIQHICKFIESKYPHGVLLLGGDHADNIGTRHKNTKDLSTMKN